MADQSLRGLVGALAQRVRGWGRPAVKAPPGWTTGSYMHAQEMIRRGILQIGSGSYGGFTIAYYPRDTTHVIIGSYCSIAADVTFIPGGNHRPDCVSTFPFRENFGLQSAEDDRRAASKGNIRLGNDVWIGKGATVLSGVTIGDGAVVGAYSVVAKNVEPYTIVTGAPAVFRKRRFEESVADALIQIAWWDWPEQVLRDRVDDLSCADVHGFIEQYR